MTLGCINPLFFDDVQPASNHAPVVTNMQPQPTFGRLAMNVGTNCAPLDTFRADRLEDADLDTLSVRFSLLVPREETIGGEPISLLEFDLEPNLEAVDGIFYVLPTFQVDRTTIVSKLGGDLQNQVDNHAAEGQLLELRISDRGFKAGSDNSVPDGAGLFFMSWAIRLGDTDCGPQ